MLTSEVAMKCGCYTLLAAWTLMSLCTSMTFNLLQLAVAVLYLLYKSTDEVSVKSLTDMTYVSSPEPRVGETDFVEEYEPVDVTTDTTSPSSSNQQIRIRQAG